MSVFHFISNCIWVLHVFVLHKTSSEPAPKFGIVHVIHSWPSTWIESIQGEHWIPNVHRLWLQMNILEANEREQYEIYHILRFDCNGTIYLLSWCVRVSLCMPNPAYPIRQSELESWRWCSLLLVLMVLCVLSAIAMVSCNESFCGNECSSSTLWIISLNCPKCIYISNLFFPTLTPQALSSSYRCRRRRRRHCTHTMHF